MSPAREMTLRELVRRRASALPSNSCPSSKYASGAGMVNRVSARALVAEGFALERGSECSPRGISFEVTVAGLLEWERLCAAPV